MKMHQTKGLLSLLIASLFAGNESHAGGPAANALPTGGAVTSGIGSISSLGNSMSITQGSEALFTRFDTFNIGSGAAVRFIQPGSQSIAVGRILGSDPSQIFGKLSANGQLFLLNPHGIVFGAGAQVNVGSLVASTLQLSDKDILSGQYALTQGASAGAIQNFGEIIAQEGGLVALVAPQIENVGVINAPAGQIALLAGESVRLELGQGGLIGVNVDGGAAQTRIDNAGSLLADGGKVWLTARQAGDLAGSAINQTGIIRANTVEERRGEIWIDAGPNGSVTLAGQTLATGLGAGQQGGHIAATAGQVQVAGKVDASANSGKGYIEIGGGFQGRNSRLNNANRTTVLASAEVKANATTEGTAGTVVVWSEQSSQVAGKLEAKGSGQASGGLVETSSKGALELNADVDVSAENGEHGRWLLDPLNIVIAGGAATQLTATNEILTVEATSINNALNTGANVEIQSANNIDIKADISKTQGARSSLTFTAGENVNLGTVAKPQQISAADAPNSGVTSSLDVVFNCPTGGCLDQTKNKVTLFGTISTNGGNVTFNKPVDLSNARPVSTSVAQVNNGDINANKSGAILFNEAVNLIGSSPVTLDSQSVKDAGGNAVSVGGDITFKTTLDSLGTGNLPLALTLNTTGSIVGSNQSGAVTFAGNVGSTNPVRSLTINGPTKVNLGDPTGGSASQTVNLKNNSGAVLTFSAAGNTRPNLILNSTSTTINVAGFGALGTSDYVQSTFDIVKGTSTAVNSQTANLQINADRSIQITDRDILGSLAGVSEPTNKALNVALNSNRLGSDSLAFSNAVNSGSIALQGQRGVNIVTNGGNIKLSGGTGGNGRAYGVSGEQNTDGILLQNTVLNTRLDADPTNQTTGTITLQGASPADVATGGTAVRLYGTSQLNAGNQNIVIDGLVGSTSGGAAKDAVLLGNGGTAGVQVFTTGAGTITITGDASGVGTAATAGASYNGVELSRGANVRTENGNLLIRGTGGGGNNVNVGENMGVRLKDADTQVTSKTGRIDIVGQTGGKTSSYAITTSGDDIAIGQRRDQTLARAPTGDTFTGNINLVGDTMKFVNNSTNRARIFTQKDAAAPPTKGIVNIRPLHDTDIQIGGTEPNPPSSDNITTPDKPLFLAGEIFSGTNAVFQPGMSEINIGQFGYDAATGLKTGETSKTITVAGATTVRDPLNLIALGGDAATGGKVAINSNLTVQGPQATDLRTLNIEAKSTVNQTTAASVLVDKLRVDAGNNALLLGPNQINTVAVQAAGNVTVNNAKKLTVETVSRNFQGATATTSGITTQRDGAATGRVLNVSANGKDADLEIKQPLLNPNGLVAVSALGEVLDTTAGQKGNAVNQTGAGTINTKDLIVRAQDNSDLTLTGNQFDRVAQDISSGAGDVSLVRGAASAGSIVIDSLTLPSTSTGAAADTVVNGISSTDVSGQVFIQNLNGGLIQTATAPVVVAGLAVNTTGSVNLSTSTKNQIDVLAALANNGSINVSNSTTLVVDNVTTQNNATTPAQLKTETGVRATGTGNSVTITVTGANADLTVKNVDNDPSPTFNNAVTGTTDVNLSTTTGKVTIEGGVLASDPAITTESASVNVNTKGGSVIVSNRVEASTNITLAEKGTSATAGTEVTINSSGSLAANGGQVQILADTGSVKINGSVVASGGAADNTGSVKVNTVNGTIDVSGNVTAAKGNVEMVAATSGDINIKSTVTADNAAKDADIVLSTANGKINLGVANNSQSTVGDLKASVNGDVRLKATSIEQFSGSEITANGLSALATGTAANSNVSLRGDNAFTVLAAKASNGTVSVKNTSTGVTTIGQVVGSSANADTLSGLSASGQVTLKTAAGVSQASGSTGVVNAQSGLYVEAASGNVSLDNADNKLDEVAVKADSQPNQNVALNSATALNLDTLQRADLTSSVPTTVAGISATGQASLNTASTLKQTSGATLKADTAALKATGEILLTDGGNAINKLAATTSDSLTFVNNKSLQISSANNAANAGVPLQVNGISTGAGKDLAIQLTGATSNLTQANGAPIDADKAVFVVPGNIALTDANNDIGRIAATAASVNVKDNAGLEIATLTSSLPSAGGPLTVSGLRANSVALDSNGAITQQAGASVVATNADIRTENTKTGNGNVVLTNRENQITNLSGRITGTADLYSATDVNIVAANGLPGLAAGAGMQVRSAQNITLQPGSVTSVTDNNLVLVADKAFTNLAGATAIQTGAGRWLIYDSNLKVEDRLGGLQPNFRRFQTSFDKQGPANVLEKGNGYLTDAQVTNPNFATLSAKVALPGAEGTAGGLGRQAIVAGKQVLGTPQGAPLNLFPSTLPAFVIDGVMNVKLGTPLLVQVNNRVPFSIALNTVMGADQVKGVSMIDGSAPPNWIQFDAEKGVIMGRVPDRQNEPFTLVVKAQLPDGTESEVQVFVTPSPKEDEEE